MSGRGASGARDPGRVAVRLVRPILRAAQQEGCDPRVLLKAAGVVVKTEDPAGIEERVTLAQYLALWEAALARVPAAFSLRVGTAVGPESHGVIGFAVVTSRTMGEAFQRSSRYHVLCTNTSRWSGDDHPAPWPGADLSEDARALVFEQDGAPGPARDAAVEFALAELVHEARALAPVRIEPLETRFQRTRPADEEPYRRYFGGKLRWGAPRNELIVPAALLALPLPKADPHMLAFFEKEAQALLARLPEDQPIGEAVRRSIVAALPTGTPSLGDVARVLELSERTLRRRLAEEKTTFQALLEGCRSELAGRYLERKDLALPEIAFLLGFSEPSPFYRAFRRWFGQSPEAYRQGTSARALAGG
jgi:AraC-like DNA-binding protein